MNSQEDMNDTVDDSDRTQDGGDDGDTNELLNPECPDGTASDSESDKGGSSEEYRTPSTLLKWKI